MILNLLNWALERRRHNAEPANLSSFPKRLRWRKWNRSSLMMVLSFKRNKAMMKTRMQILTLACPSLDVPTFVITTCSESNVSKNLTKITIKVPKKKRMTLTKRLRTLTDSKWTVSKILKYQSFGKRSWSWWYELPNSTRWSSSSTSSNGPRRPKSTSRQCLPPSSETSTSKTSMSTMSSCKISKWSNMSSQAHSS